jgi:hypothetical protein
MSFIDSMKTELIPIRLSTVLSEEEKRPSQNDESITQPSIGSTSTLGAGDGDGPWSKDLKGGLSSLGGMPNSDSASSPPPS